MIFKIAVFFLTLFCFLRRVFSEASFAKRNASALREASTQMSEKSLTSSIEVQVKSHITLIIKHL